jgi:uncharacterized protein (TIGR02117 family)
VSWRAASIVVALACAACNGPVRGLYPPPPDAPVRTIYAYNNYWHTGIVLRHDDLPPEHRTIFEPFGDAAWSEYGWGDAAYYPASKVTSGLLLQAALLPTDSVMHVVAVGDDPRAYYARYETVLYRIELSKAGFERVVSFVAASFESGEDGRPVFVSEGLYGRSGFYRARGRYWIFHTCNHWTADGLRAGGFPITPMHAGLATNLDMQMRLFGPRYQDNLVVQSIP